MVVVTSEMHWNHRRYRQSHLSPQYTHIYGVKVNNHDLKPFTVSLEVEA